MNYYEIVDPYYSLIKADNSFEAVELYIRNVAGEEYNFKELLEEVKLVPEYYAAAKYSRAVGEDMQLVNLSEIVNDLKSDESKVLIIDGSLI